MIDFHSHIVYDVDDGSETLENSIKILKLAEKAGFDNIILTPHYMEDYYEYQVNDITDRIQVLKQKCREENININLYQANEIYITNHMVDLLENNIASTINKSRYVLFELPMNNEAGNLLEVVYSLIKDKKVPIIAHPERYTYIQKDPNKLLDLVDQGVLFQTNYGSILGQYGKDAQKTAKLLIKNNFISFLGTDVHKTGHIYEGINQAKSELEKIISKREIYNLTQGNAEKVLLDEELDELNPIPIKKSFFEKIFS